MFLFVQGQCFCTFSYLCYMVQDQEMDAFRGFFPHTSFLSQRGGQSIPSIGHSTWYLVLLVLLNMALSGRMIFCPALLWWCSVFCPKASLTEMNWEKTTRRASWNTFRFFAIPCLICEGLLTSWRLGSKEPCKWRHWFLFQRNLPKVSFFPPPLTEKCTQLIGGFGAESQSAFPRVMILPGPVAAANTLPQRFTTDDFAVPSNHVSSLG